MFVNILCMEHVGQELSNSKTWEDAFPMLPAEIVALLRSDMGWHRTSSWIPAPHRSIATVGNEVQVLRGKVLPRLDKLPCVGGTTRCIQRMETWGYNSCQLPKGSKSGLEENSLAYLSKSIISSEPLTGTDIFLKRKSSVSTEDTANAPSPGTNKFRVYRSFPLTLRWTFT